MKQENIIMILPIIGIILLIINYFVFGIKQTSSMIFMVAIYSLFLGSFFFTFGAWVEEQTVKGQIKSLTEEGVKMYHLFIGDKEISKMESDTSEDDKKVEERNKKTVKEAMTVLGIGCAIGITISYSLCIFVKGGNQAFKELAIKNLTVLIFVALTQAIFFYTVSRTYKSLDYNNIIRTIIDDNF
jgi:hypothetical protein